MIFDVTILDVVRSINVMSSTPPPNVICLIVGGQFGVIIIQVINQCTQAVQGSDRSYPERQYRGCQAQGRCHRRSPSSSLQ